MIAAYLTYLSEDENESKAVRALLLLTAKEHFPGLSEEEGKRLFEKMGLPEDGLDSLPRMEKGEHGKPYFPDYPNAHFSLSHTKGCVCCAWSDRPVGIDVERLREIRYRDGVADKFSKDEQDYVRKNNDLLRFFRIWTGKESFTKRDGRGFLIPPESYSVLDYSDLEEKAGLGGEDCHIRFLRAEKEEYVLSVCGHDDTFALTEL